MDNWIDYQFKEMVDKYKNVNRVRIPVLGFIVLDGLFLIRMSWSAAYNGALQSLAGIVVFFILAIVGVTSVALGTNLIFKTKWHKK